MIYEILQVVQKWAAKEQNGDNPSYKAAKRNLAEAVKDILRFH